MEDLEAKKRRMFERLSPETRVELKKIAAMKDDPELFTAFGMPEIDELLALAAGIK